MQFLFTDLIQKLKHLDSNIYRKYKSLHGSYASQSWILFIDKASVDPKSKASNLRIRVPLMYSNFPAKYLTNKIKTIPLCDYIHRKFYTLSKKLSKPSGTGKSNIFYVEPVGSQILERSTILFGKNYIEARFRYGLPAKGNRIDAEAFINTLENAFPKIVKEILSWESFDAQEVGNFISCYEDQETLRKFLSEKKLNAFIPNGAILPRESAFIDKPLKNAIPFKSPKNLEITFKLQNNKTITGMGIPNGITIITGGGFHGKTTLLNAIKMGIYNHIPGDGREYVVAIKNSFKINSEDGRIAQGLNISPYIVNLPLNKNSEFFSTNQCSGSTSQAANVIEAIRMGIKCLLFDEDSSATNFLINDAIMNKIIGADKTIIPYLETSKDLFEKHKVSTIMVVGSLCNSFDIADLVIKMSNYEPLDITKFSKELISNNPVFKLETRPFNSKALIQPRFIDSSNFRIHKRINPFKPKINGSKQLSFEKIELNFPDNEQLIEMGQTRIILELILKLEELIFNKKFNFEDALHMLFKNQTSISDLIAFKDGYTELRAIDLAYALNRFRLLKIQIS